MFSFGILCFHFSMERQNAESLTKATNVVIEYSPSKRLFHSVESQYDLNKMVVKIQLTDEYNQMDVAAQFAVLEYFNRQIRYILRNTTFNNSIYDLNLEIIGQVDSNIYHLTNVVPENQSFLQAYSRFFKNGEMVYTTSQLQNAISLYRDEDSFNQKHKEILQYSYRFFNMITKNGRYYEPERDNEVISDMIARKFDITSEEYSQLYLDYYFHFAK